MMLNLYSIQEHEEGCPNNTTEVIKLLYILNSELTV